MKSDHSYTHIVENLRSLCVIFGLQVVNVAIYLDRKLKLMTVEIDDKPSKDNLATKWNT